MGVWNATWYSLTNQHIVAHKLRSYSANIAINTASSCDGPTCSVPELVAVSASVSLTLIQTQITADSLQYVS